MNRHLSPTVTDPAQLALMVEMTDLAARYHTAERDMLGGVVMELILALLEGGEALSAPRRQSMIAAGALILRLSDNDGQHRSESTARMLTRLGMPQISKDEADGN